MDQSRRAVESYWRSKIVDAATSDEDKVTPVYKLEELCDLLRSSPVAIVKELTEFIVKRLDHKSPVVKQKALRVVKYAVGKSGTEFRREMQRNSISVRQLIHYKGHPDPLKGDALNKVVRETAQEALSTLFSSDESKAAPTESSLGSRIQGFGSTNYVMPSDDKKSFISEVVGMGSATIKQGLSSFTQSPSLRKNNDAGNYKSPNLRRSLTGESEYSERYEGIGSHAETHNTSRFSNNAGSGNWGQDVNASQAETSSGNSDATYSQKTREEKLLETIVTSGGVRLQPTREALHAFLVEASRLNALALGRAIETKLKSPMWQIRMKAMCVLEAIVRKKEDENCSVISSYFIDNNDVVVQCSESPQASVREKANKVLSLLGGEQGGGAINYVQKSAKAPQPSMMPDLIDTGDSSDIFGPEDSKTLESESRTTNTATSTAPLIDDLFGNSFAGTESTNVQTLDDDPFADVNFHTGQHKDHVADLFSGVAVDESGINESQTAAQKNEFGPFDLLNSSGKDVNDLMGDLSVNGHDTFKMPNDSTVGKSSEHLNSKSSVYQDAKIPNIVLNNEFTSQATGTNATPMVPLGAMGYNVPPGVMFNPAFASHPMNYGAMGSIFAQQQFLATLSNFQQLGNNFQQLGNNFQQLGNMQSNAGIGAPGSNTGNNSSPIPDIFNPGVATQPPTSLMNDSKREETRAFDFISDHVASARDPKRVV